MQWWLWILIGMVLLAVEVAVPGGIIFLFFGAAAVALGILVALGLGGPIWFQWLLFSFLSIAGLLLLRRPILERLKTRSDSTEVDSLVGRPVVALEDLPPGAIGKAELRGTSWSAENVGAEPLARGERGVVAGVDGLKLQVRAQ